MIENHQETNNSTNKRAKTALFIIPLILLVAFWFIVPSVSSQATEPTEPQVKEEIKENVKERLEKAISEQPAELQLKRAWVGILESIANNTLTIETREGPKLASTSAETTYIKLPNRSAVSQEDLEIGSFTIAMGFLNGNHVLKVSRVVIDTQAPELPLRQSYFVNIIEYNQTKNTISLGFPDETTKTLTIGKNSQLTKGENSQVLEADADDTQGTTRAIVIVEIEKDNQEEITTLLHLHLLPELEPKPDIEISEEGSVSKLPATESASDEDLE